MRTYRPGVTENGDSRPTERLFVSPTTLSNICSVVKSNVRLFRSTSEIRCCGPDAEVRGIGLTDSMRRVPESERRARLGTRHHLARPARSLTEAVAGVVGLHASDPSTVYLSAQARTSGLVSEDLEQALYGERTLVRLWGMRKTLFVTTRALAGIMHAASPDAFGAAERRRLSKMLTDQGKTNDADAWIDNVTTAVLGVLNARGEATANGLRDEIPEMRETLTFGEGKSWGGTVGTSTRVLFLLAADGAIMRGRPLGSWVSSQYRWVPTAVWLGEPLPAMDPAEARAELVRRWLERFGPGTTLDVKWWTGWTVRNTRAALSAVGAVEVDLANGPGWLLPDDLEPAEIPGDWIALLPGLDSTVMGWKERYWYLGEHAPNLFDRNGNAGPTVWWNGRIVGGWAQCEDGAVAYRLLEPVSPEVTRMVESEAHRLELWLGTVRVIPRFRTPLEKELTS